MFTSQCKINNNTRPPHSSVSSSRSKQDTEISVILGDGEDWKRKVQAEKIVKQDSNEPDYRFRVPKYETKGQQAEREISVQFEIQLQDEAKFLSEPLSIIFYFAQEKKRKVSRMVDYREYSTEEDDDDSNIENRDLNVGHKRRKSFSKRRQSKKCRKSQQDDASSEGKESQCSDVFELRKLLDLIDERTITMLDVLKMISFLEVDNSELLEFSHSSYENEEIDNILSSMHSFDDDIAGMLDCSSLSDTDPLDKANRIGTILSENQMERIIADLISGKNKLDELNIPSTSSIPAGNVSQQEQAELILIEDTFKSMALDLPEFDLEINQQL